MYYAITHLTIYQYSQPITDSVMEIRMQPVSNHRQRCVRFNLDVSPDSKVFAHRDYLENTMHTFNIPAPHERLAIKAEALVEVKPTATLPTALSPDAWRELDYVVEQDRDIYDMLLPGQYAQPTSLLQEFANELNWFRRDDPLSLLLELNSQIYDRFEYRQNVTKVDSLIDVALEARSGVCQDFAHIMLAMMRQVGIPGRYISGYLFHRHDDHDHDRSDEDASHAWVEAWLPDYGWVGFDPTNNLIVTDRHIRVTVANDYASASPSRGVFKGNATTKLDVRVKVSKLDDLPVEEKPLDPEIVMPHYQLQHIQQQQQQQ